MIGLRLLLVSAIIVFIPQQKVIDRIGNWQIRASQDPITDEVTLLARLQALETHDPGFFIISADDSQLSGLVIIPTREHEFPGYVRVEYRLDDEESVEEMWITIDGIYAPDKTRRLEILQKWSKAMKLVFRIHFSEWRSVTLIFDLARIEDALKRIGIEIKSGAILNHPI